MPDRHRFALCLTHDVDRPYKRAHHALYYGLRDRSLRPLRSLVDGSNPYWQFERIMALERELGVRSAFYFLDEPHLLRDRGPRALLSPRNWVQHLGRYDLTRPPVSEIIQRLDDGGWEVGLHGSLATTEDRERLRTEKAHLESVLGHEVGGIRQHYLDLSVPETWEHQAALGFDYDASLGSGVVYGFQHGYGLKTPLASDFTVFPLTLMEQTLPDPAATPEAVWGICESLLAEAERNSAVMTVLWHPRFFSEEDFPGYTALYRRLVRTALDRGAWVGPPGDLLSTLDDAAEPGGDPVAQGGLTSDR